MGITFGTCEMRRLNRALVSHFVRNKKKTLYNRWILISRVVFKLRFTFHLQEN